MFGMKVQKIDSQIYEKELKDFLPTRVIDVHTHIYKKDFKPYGSHNSGSSWTDRVAEDQSAEDLLQTYRDLFPGKNVMPLIFGGVLQDLQETNDYVRQKSTEYGFPALYRSDYAMSPEELEEKVKAGGFLGLKPYLSNCPSYLPSREVRIFDFLPKEHLETANRNGWIVMLHLPRDGRLKDKVNLAQLLEIDCKFPNIKMIVAHVGRAYAKEDFGDAFQVLKQTKHMMFDFTANLLDEAITEGIRTVGVKRFLFGSDLPIAKMRMYRIVENGIYYNVVPRGYYGDVHGEAHMRESDREDITVMIYEQLLAFKRSAIQLSLKDEEIEDILYGNAQRMFNALEKKR